MNERKQKDNDSLNSLKNVHSSDFQYLLTNFLHQYYEKQTNIVQKINATTLQKIEGIEVENIKQKSFVRFLNVVPTMSTVRIFLDGIQITDLSYKNASNYLELSSGNHQFDIYDSNHLSQPIQTVTIFLEKTLYYTFALTYELNQIRILQIVDDPYLPMNETKIRFIHLAKAAPHLDLAVKQGEGDVVFSNVSYKETSDYLSLTPMSVNLELRLSGTKSIVYPLYKTRFQKNKIYDIISIGLMNEDPTFEVLMIK
ncbi:DUF4397 domain-containing protein [Bacillus sp. JJ664]